MSKFEQKNNKNYKIKPDMQWLSKYNRFTPHNVCRMITFTTNTASLKKLLRCCPAMSK